MQHAATGVLKTAGVEDQVAVGTFDGAAVVVEQVADLETGSASGAQGTQFAGVVVDAGSGDCQGAVTFDDTQAVVKCTAKGQIDGGAGDLAVVVAAVVEVVAGNADAACGVETAVAVVDVGGGEQ